MHLILTTCAFLVIFSIFSFAQLQKLKESNTTESVYTNCFGLSVASTSKLIAVNAKDAFHKLCPDAPKPQKEGKLTSHLHISSLIQKEDKPQVTEESKTAKVLLKRTILALYGDKTFFLEAGMNDAKVDDFIATLFFNAKDLPTKNFLKKPQSLANVNMQDKTYQGLLYKMLKGNTPPNEGSIAPQTNPENYKSLTNFIRFERRATLTSVYLAPEEILTALFSDPDTVKEVMAARMRCFREQEKETKNKKNQDQNTPPVQNQALEESKKEFEKFRDALIEGIDKSLIDFQISHTNPNACGKDS